MCVALILIKKYCKSDRARQIAIMVSAGLLLVSIIFNRIALSFRGDSWSWVRLIPGTICGVTSIVFSIVTLAFFRNRNHAVFHFLVYVAIIGGFLVTIYPDFIGQNASLMYLPTISGLIHHTLSLYLGILLIVVGEFKPHIKKWYCLLLGYFVYVTYGLFAAQVIGISNSMQIENPFLPGLYWWVIMIIVSAVIYSTLGVLELIRYRIKRRRPGE